MSDIDLTPEALKRKLDALKNGVEETEKPATSPEKTLEEINIERSAKLDLAVAKEEGITDEEKVQARNLLKVSSILKSADEVRRIYIKEMLADDGAPLFVEYCMLNTAEIKEVINEADAKDRNLKELFIRVRKADPSVLEDDIRKLPDQYIQLILLKIRREEDYRFLLPALSRNLSSLRALQMRR